MKQNKLRILSMLCVLAVVLSACGSKETGGSLSSSSADASTRERSSLKDTIKEREAQAEKEEEEVIEEEPEEEAVTEEDFSLGVMKEDVYTNDFFDLKLEIPDNWFFATEEEIQMVNEAVIDAVDDEDAGDLAESMAKELDDGSTYIDMIAYEEQGYFNVNITIGTITVGEQMLHASGNYLDEMVKENGQDLIDMYENYYDMENVRMATGDTMFQGQYEPSLFMEASQSGVPVYMRQVSVVQGRYIATITATSYIEDHNDEILAEFTTVN